MQRIEKYQTMCIQWNVNWYSNLSSIPQNTKSVLITELGGLNLPSRRTQPTLIDTDSLPSSG